MNFNLARALDKNGRAELGRFEVQGCLSSGGGPARAQDVPDFYGLYVRDEDGLARHLLDYDSARAALAALVYLNETAEGLYDRAPEVAPSLSVSKNAAAITMAYSGPAPEPDFWGSWEDFMDFIVEVANELEVNRIGEWALNYDWYETVDAAAELIGLFNRLVEFAPAALEAPSARNVALAALRKGKSPE